MIVFRQTDVDVPFFWEGDRQPAGRWHGPGEGPAQYTSSTPEAAWAELVRHLGIRDPADLVGIVRAMWVIEITELDPPAVPALPAQVMTGGTSTYPACRAEAARIRSRGGRWLSAPSAALVAGVPSGWRTEDGLVPGPPIPAVTCVWFGARPDAVGTLAGVGEVPDATILGRVRHLR